MRLESQSVGTPHEQTGWVEESDAGKGGSGGGGGGSGSVKRKASFSGDTASIGSGSSAPGSPSSAFTIPKRKKVCTHVDRAAFLTRRFGRCLTGRRVDAGDTERVAGPTPVRALLIGSCFSSMLLAGKGFLDQICSALCGRGRPSRKLSKQRIEREMHPLKPNWSGAQYGGNAM